MTRGKALRSQQAQICYRSSDFWSSMESQIIIVHSGVLYAHEDHVVRFLTRSFRRELEPIGPVWTFKQNCLVVCTQENSGHDRRPVIF